MEHLMETPIQTNPVVTNGKDPAPALDPVLASVREQAAKLIWWPEEHQLYGPNLHCDLLFMHWADEIKRETGIDVYRTKEQMEADEALLLRLIKQHRRDRRFADESMLDAMWQEFLREKGMLTEEEQQEKDECNLSKARTAKEKLRESGMSDAARFGYCKRTSCTNRKVERLLLRGFCPDCRGIKVKQRVANGGRFDATKRFCLDATTQQAKTSLRVSANRKNVHPDVLELTAEQRRNLVQTTKQQNPLASEREIAKLTKVSRTTVQDILKNPIVKTKPENTIQVKQFLRERAEEQTERKQQARVYLTERNIKSRAESLEFFESVYVLAETGHFEGKKAVETGHPHLPPCAAIYACPTPV